MTTSIDLESLEKFAIVQANSYRKQLLNSAPTRNTLHGWIHTVLDVYIPRYSICQGHVSPYQYFSDRYFNDKTKTIGWACRTGGKSFLTGLDCWLKARFQAGWSANILGGSLDQSKKAYKATQYFWGKTADIGGYNVLVKEPLISETTFKNGSSYGISTASTRSAHGPHQNELCLDEVDEMDIDVLNAALEQPQSLNGHPASWHYTSTLHRVGGLMSDWVDNGEARGYTLYTWCSLETMEGCYDYSCSTCIIDEYCQGRMKGIMEIAEQEQIESGIIDKGDRAILGFNSVDDIISKIRNAQMTEGSGLTAQLKPLDVAADLFCKRPSRTGLVYKEFDRNKHVVSEIKIGEDWRKYRTFDFGLSSPWVCLYIAEDHQGRVYIYDEIYVIGRTTNNMIAKMTDGIKYDMNIAGPAHASDRAILGEHGIITVHPKKMDIRDGILFTKQLLADKLDGKPGLLIDGKRCPNTVFEFEKGYRYPDNVVSEKPVDENDHAMEAFQNYVKAKRYGGARQTVGVYA